jgi:peptide subunit release factor 1 (eRF1)
VRINRYLESGYDVSADGLALFVFDGRGLFETVEADVPFRQQATVAPQPDLFQLARLLDEQETAVVAVVDSNTSRLFVTRRGGFEEKGGFDEHPKYFRTRPMVGGLNQASFQRHNANKRAEFARETADEVQRLLDTEGASRIVLAGDQVAMPILQEALSPRLADSVEGVVRLDIRAPRDEVAEKVWPVLEQAEAEQSRSAADRLMDSVRVGGLGASGLDATRTALERGQVDELLLVPRRGPTRRCARTWCASLTSATVTVVDEHAGLQTLGGVGALLRYRHD